MCRDIKLLLKFWIAQDEENVKLMIHFEFSNAVLEVAVIKHRFACVPARQAVKTIIPSCDLCRCCFLVLSAYSASSFGLGILHLAPPHPRLRPHQWR